MNFQNTPLAAGLYLVATPLGNARDITLRALDILASADMLAAEDTRTLLKLMTIHGVPLRARKIQAFHDHSKPKDRARILDAVAAGQSVAYATDAGTPLIADPGYTLVAAAREAGLPVTSAPGPSALVTALSIAGLPTDQFGFYGFAPSAQTARRTFLAGLGQQPHTATFYEAPSRIARCLEDAAEIIGAERQAALCRELTKRFEDVQLGTLGELADHYRTHTPRGEFVVLISKAAAPDVTEADVDAAIRQALSTMRIKDAAEAVAGSFGLPKRDVYQRALGLRREEGEL